MSGRRFSLARVRVSRVPQVRLEFARILPQVVPPTENIAPIAGAERVGEFAGQTRNAFKMSIERLPIRPRFRRRERVGVDGFQTGSGRGESGPFVFALSLT